jgi:hypothetical protein
MRPFGLRGQAKRDTALGVRVDWQVRGEFSASRRFCGTALSPKRRRRFALPAQSIGRTGFAATTLAPLVLRIFALKLFFDLGISVAPEGF